jgi:hypothetical protein
MDGQSDNIIRDLLRSLEYALTYGPECAMDNKMHANQRDAALKSMAIAETYLLRERQC